MTDDKVIPLQDRIDAKNAMALNEAVNNHENKFGAINEQLVQLSRRLQTMAGEIQLLQRTFAQTMERQFALKADLKDLDERFDELAE